MVRSKFLLGLALSVAIAFVVAPATAATNSCSSAGSLLGSCSGAQVSSNSVNVWGRTTTPGRVVDVVAPSVPSASVARTGKPTPFYPTGEIAFNCVFRLATRAACVPTPVQPAPVVAADYYAPITLEDLASFSPQQVSVTSEPSGWTVLGAQTNFIASAQQHIVGGTLFGKSAEVRFTPVGFDWNYGDGVTRTSRGGGASWADLGLAEFSSTETSHVYQVLGEFITSVTARYSAEYRIEAAQWISVQGEVRSSASTGVLLVQNAETVLAARDCLHQRGQPSCPR